MAGGTGSGAPGLAAPNLLGWAVRIIGPDRGRPLARAHESALVRQHNELGAVPQVQLAHLTWLIVGRLGCWGLVVGGIVRVAWVEVRTNVGV